jgi:antitoxin PrlF
VLLQRAEEPVDPVLESFLEFMAHDMITHPQHIRAIDTALAKRMRTLTKGVNVDLEAALDPADE